MKFETVLFAVAFVLLAVISLPDRNAGQIDPGAPPLFTLAAQHNLNATPLRAASAQPGDEEDIAERKSHSEEG